MTKIRGLFLAVLFAVLVPVLAHAQQGHATLAIPWTPPPANCPHQAGAFTAVTNAATSIGGTTISFLTSGVGALNPIDANVPLLDVYDVTTSTDVGLVQAVSGGTVTLVNGPYATGIGVTSGAATAVGSGDTIRFSWRDGCAGANQNAYYKRSDCFSGYFQPSNALAGQYVAHLMPFDVAGCDYPVGTYTPRASLNDPSVNANLPSGCYYSATGWTFVNGPTYTGPEVVCSDPSWNGVSTTLPGFLSNLTLNLKKNGVGYDFGANSSFHGGNCILLYIDNSNSNTPTINIDDSWFEADANCAKQGGTQMAGLIELGVNGGVANNLGTVNISNSTFLGHMSTIQAVTLQGSTALAEGTQFSGVWSYYDNVSMTYSGPGQILGKMVYQNAYNSVGRAQKATYKFNLWEGIQPRCPNGHAHFTGNTGGNPTYSTLTGATLNGTTLTFSSYSNSAPAIGMVVGGNGTAGVVNTMITGGSGLSWTVNHNYTSPIGPQTMYAYTPSPSMSLDQEFNTFFADQNSAALCATTVMFDQAAHAASLNTTIYHGNTSPVGSLTHNAPEINSQFSYQIDDGNGTFSGTCPNCTYTTSNVAGGVLTVTAIGSYFNQIAATQGPVAGMQAPGTYPLSLASSYTGNAGNGGVTTGVGSQWRYDCTNVTPSQPVNGTPFVTTAGWSPGSSVTIQTGSSTAGLANLGIMDLELFNADGGTGAKGYVGWISSVSGNNFVVSSTTTTGASGHHLYVSAIPTCALYGTQTSGNYNENSMTGLYASPAISGNNDTWSAAWNYGGYIVNQGAPAYMINVISGNYSQSATDHQNVAHSFFSTNNATNGYCAYPTLWGGNFDMQSQNRVDYWDAGNNGNCP